ncbi:hypothetical protein COV19_03940 [Candidatus Woesearchaeota archaeon CG10_big_fil_rev_8_21_14_0_10_44_13]|nr:MAG: hypothetical protein COV19_03940 [Candidatus Woesearchaeota archaeon CG10_big_fil_rev_8_21_14_0_10_44_13]
MAVKSSKGGKGGKAKLEELKLLDLRGCSTVSEIVAGMERCSFGARMLGEIASTLASFASSKDSSERPLIIYDGKTNTELAKLLQSMVKKGWFTRMITPEAYSLEKAGKEKNVLVVGLYSERFEDAIYKKPKRTIFINNCNEVKPGQIKDGFFPDVVFSDPRYIMPLLYHVLLERIEGKKTTVVEFVKEIGKYGGLSQKVADGAETFNNMVNDKGCFKFLTLSGAMTIAKMGLVICDMIDLGMINAVASTGALMAHGLVESLGLKHYKHNPAHSDSLLAARKLNRVTDTLEPETNFTDVDKVIEDVLDRVDEKEPMSPIIFHRLIGKYLHDRYPNERGILKSAYEKDVPVMVPAFIDSEIANDVYVHNLERGIKGRDKIIFNLELDSQALVNMVTKTKKTGIFTIGGGVPRNNVQNVAPLLEIINDRINAGLPEKQFSYGVKIAPDEMYYGHLSGCTYSEGMSWRKMDPKGKFAEIKGDATMIWPFIVKYVMEKNKMV